VGCDPLIQPPESGLDFAWRATVDLFPPLSLATVPRTGISVLNIPRGRGYLELMSPDLFVEWNAITWKDRVSQLDTPLTGPASRNGLWIQDGIVTLTANIWGGPRGPVNSQTGIEGTGSNTAPALTVIWHPGATPSDIEDSWRFRAVVASDLRFPARPILPNTDELLHCVGHARHWSFQCASVLDLNVGIVSGTPLVVDPYRVAAGITTATGAGSPWTVAKITSNAGTPVAYNLTWDRYPMNIA